MPEKVVEHLQLNPFPDSKACSVGAQFPEAVRALPGEQLNRLGSLDPLPPAPPGSSGGSSSSGHERGGRGGRFPCWCLSSTEGEGRASWVAGMAEGREQRELGGER